MTILLVDDDPDDQDIFREAVSIAKPGCELLFASNGVEALLALRNTSFLPDFIFLDLNMPKMGGKEFLQIVRSDAAYERIPIVIYSTSGHKTDVGDFFKMGASNYITKPSEFKLLITYLQTILR